MIYESAASAAAPLTHPCHLLLSAPVSGPAVGGKEKNQNMMTQNCFIHLLFILSKSLLIFNQPNPLKILIMSLVLQAASSLGLCGTHTRSKTAVTNRVTLGFVS